MGELENLRREEKKLLSQQKVMEEMDKRQREKGKVKKRIFVLKHPKIMKVLKVGKRTAGKFGIMTKAGIKKARPYLEQGLKNYNENMLKPARVVRVKKVKRKKKKKVRRARENNFGNPFGNPFG